MLRLLLGVATLVWHSASVGARHQHVHHHPRRGACVHICAGFVCDRRPPGSPWRRRQSCAGDRHARLPGRPRAPPGLARGADHAGDAERCADDDDGGATVGLPPPAPLTPRLVLGGAPLSPAALEPFLRELGGDRDAAAAEAAQASQNPSSDAIGRSQFESLVSRGFMRI